MNVTCFYSNTQIQLYNNENPQRVDCHIYGAHMSLQHALPTDFIITSKRSIMDLL
jgi:hypothetical protein